jgi:hypothetical protein
MVSSSDAAASAWASTASRSRCELAPREFLKGSQNPFAAEFPTRIRLQLTAPSVQSRRSVRSRVLSETVRPVSHAGSTLMS